ncbi:MAG: phosphatase PAP2 family protein [Firmicutes bacterium]|nr:phosphatase PAP2 family protein [Bacillota bacterium]
MGWELDFLNWINQTMHGWTILNQIFRYITVIGDGGTGWFLLGIILTCIKKTRRAGLTLLAGVIVLGSINNYVIKLLVARPRPYNVAGGEELKVFVDATLTPLINIGSVHLFGMSKDLSFMSGHTVSSAVAATIVYSFNKKVGIPVIVVAVLVSLSRLFLVVHYPTDVIAGAIFGVAGGLGVVWASNKIDKKIKANKSLKESQKTTKIA